MKMFRAGFLILSRFCVPQFIHAETMNKNFTPEEIKIDVLNDGHYRNEIRNIV